MSRCVPLGQSRLQEGRAAGSERQRAALTRPHCSAWQLMAEDADSPPNAQIRFSIASGDRDDEFAVDPVLGLVKVKKKLDRERVSGYSLLVQAVDSGLPTMSATTTVNIDISDVNDNGPEFTPANYTAVIQRRPRRGLAQSCAHTLSQILPCGGQLPPA
ncbi:PREDICTED: fat-like cadherin-related tumor suppressor homolog [Condylura cristata]|uniref:fat-like cadherin-related tumor suppressor homolog n=1 Tax=Condylura cristata TaxID=143302 RepID=UPI000642A984|nr:PREDICTED: fat-like cadherin-related tumor suppressor homolog [Condylura cristata]